MAGRVIWTQLASTEFEAAIDYIGQVSTAYAASFARRVLNAVELLAEWPESGAIVTEFDEPSLRETYVKNHRIIYRLVNEGICVVAIIQAARDLRTLWNDADRTGYEGN